MKNCENLEGMGTEKYITITELCSGYSIDTRFVNDLREYGLMEIITFENQEVIPEEKVREFEKFVRLHYDLEINLEGIDAIKHLLDQIQGLREEVRDLRNKLNRWEK